MKVPFVDLSRADRQIHDSVFRSLESVVAQSSYILGPDVEEFEDRFASYCETEYCVGVASGTDALELALRAVGVSSSDEVVLPANTFIATALAVIRIGARPVLADCDRSSYLMDLDALERVITPRTRAVIPVHLYGQLVDVQSVREIVGDLPIIEDGAQAHGARRDGRLMGAFGDMAATSFYPSKNLGAYGDGGAILTNSSEYASRLRELRNWGSTVKYEHPTVGFNSRLDTFQAAVLNVKLPYLDQWNQQRAALASRYTMELKDKADLSAPAVSPNHDPAWHLYVVEVSNRDKVIAGLGQHGIQTGIHYPKPVHLHASLSDLGYKVGDFPNSEAAADRILSLPLFPGMTEEEISEVIRRMHEITC